MEKQDYTATIEVKAPAEKAFESINNVNGWWSEKIKGNSEHLNDVFIIDFGGDAFVKHQLIEVVPNTKVVWEVTDCFLPWFSNKTEWTNTKMSFEISSENDLTNILFTHIGLVPEVDCYDMCTKGWDQYIKSSLFKLITEGVGEPQKK